MITPQYTRPLGIGESSPFATATIASSSSGTASFTRPSSTRSWAWDWATRANRSASPKRSAMRIASPAVAIAAGRSPAASCWNMRGISR